MLEEVNYALSFSDEQAMILKTAREFCQEKSPIASVRALLQTESGFDATIWNEMADLGWLGAAIPEEFGGLDLGIGSVVPIAESMGRHLLSNPFLSTSL